MIDAFGARATSARCGNGPNPPRSRFSCVVPTRRHAQPYGSTPECESVSHFANNIITPFFCPCRRSVRREIPEHSCQKHQNTLTSKTVYVFCRNNGRGTRMGPTLVRLAQEFSTETKGKLTPVDQTSRVTKKGESYVIKEGRFEHEEGIRDRSHHDVWPSLFRRTGTEIRDA